MFFATGQKFTSLAFAFLFAIPVHAVTQVEGRVNASSKQTGVYDLLVQVWTNTGESGKSKLLQTIQIPMVKVEKGAFRIALDVNLDGSRQSDFSIKVKSRPFEAWEPFQPAEVSQVRNETVVPPLVLR